MKPGELPRRALFVGVDHYKNHLPLSGAVADAKNLAEKLSTHADGSPNFVSDPKALMLGEEYDALPVDFAALHTRVRTLLEFDGDALFFYSGHGIPQNGSLCLCTQDGTAEQPGLSVADLLRMANKSRAASVTIILDCCHAGMAQALAPTDEDDGPALTELRENVTILAASRGGELAIDRPTGGLFTELLLSGLDGAAADERGFVTAPALYASAELLLTAWQQRPIFKSHSARMVSLRRCQPRLDDERLGSLVRIFEHPDKPLTLDTSYEKDERVKDPFHGLKADPQHLKDFEDLKRFRDCGLLAIKLGMDLYGAAMSGGTVWLTPRGKFYWQLWRGSRRGSIVEDKGATQATTPAR